MRHARRIVPEISDEEEARIQAGIASDPDNPELTDAAIAELRPAQEVLSPALYAALINRGGRPKASVRKVSVTIRLDARTVEAFKATGAGWQTRMNEALAEAAAKLR